MNSQLQQIAPKGIKSYKSNPNLKCSGVSFIFTKAQIEERIKCMQNPIYFIQKYMKIVHVDKGLVPFDLYDFQKDLLQSYIDNRFTIAKLPRQVGKSTVTIGFILWTVLFGPMQNIAILANKASTARDILGKLQLAYEHIPLWMQQGILSWNKGSIELENGSKVIAAATASSSARGNTYNIIFLDEFAFVPKNIAEEFITSVYPTISSGKTTKVIMVSTPNGMNLFYKYWVDAVHNRNLYKPIEAHWSVVPGRDDKWAEDQIKQLGQEKFDQEFGCSFLGSSNTLVSSSKLATMAWVSPLQKINNLSIYEHPRPGRIYIITVDTAEGQGLDYSAFCVVDCTESPYRVVAKYYDNRVTPMLYPNIIFNVGAQYNMAHVLVETNAIGMQVVEILHNDLEYENIFSTTNLGRGGQRISAGFKKNSKLGIKMTGQIKSIGCSNLKSMLETNKLIVEDFEIVSELTSFVATGSSFAAEPGCHDDLTMCLVLFSWLTAQPMFKELTDVDIRRKIYDEKMTSLTENLLPFGVLDDGSNKNETFKDSEGTVWEHVDLPKGHFDSNGFFWDDSSIDFDEEF
jgi:Terminase RNaseH-like domain/Terminase large subunit, T4likevirus-type, N-terminal